MKKFISANLTIIVLLFSMIILSGCFSLFPKPDLILVNPQGLAGFCDLDGSGNLRVYVKNQGDASAGSSNARVSFGQFGEVIKPVPALGVGETTTVLFPVPAGCFNPDCGFEITVDVYNDINESKENNNSQTGNCLG